MVNVSHATLTGSELHEPKGADTAAVNTVYVSDGAGSGSWVDINSLVTATNFTTGDVKPTIKTTADSSWIMMNDGTIGDALSGASTRANADCEDLFLLLWNNVSDTYAPVTGGRGANAAADWAAHKKITTLKVLGRALAGAGAGSGLTSRSLGQTLGEENHTMTQSELVSHQHTGTTSGESATHTHAVSGTTSTESNDHTHSDVGSGGAFLAAAGGSAVAPFTTGSTGGISATHTHTFSVTSGGQSVGHTHTITTAATGSTTPFNVMQPTLFLNYMMKL